MTAIPSETMHVADIALSAIDVAPGRRRIDPTWIEALSDQFASQGQLTPIEVIYAGDRYRLVVGAHRLAAAKLLGWQRIAAVVKSPDDFASEAEITLRELTENLVRRELSELDRAVDISRWREVYEATHLVMRVGRPKCPSGDLLNRMNRL